MAVHQTRAPLLLPLRALLLLALTVAALRLMLPQPPLPPRLPQRQTERRQHLMLDLRAHCCCCHKLCQHQLQVLTALEHHSMHCPRLELWL